MSSAAGCSRSFSIQRDDAGSSMNLQIVEQSGVSAENLSLSTWGSSFILANLLHKLDVIKRQREVEIRTPLSVLELGAGTGLVGLSMAASFKSDVLLTDLPTILPALHANTTVNTQLFFAIGSTVSCGVLDWNNAAVIAVSHNADPRHQQIMSAPAWPATYILAADTIYSEEHPELLSNVILIWLARSRRAHAILCYPLRVAYIEHIQRFWELMEAAGLECVEQGREEGAESWNEVANTPYEWCVWTWRDLEGST